MVVSIMLITCNHGNVRIKWSHVKIIDENYKRHYTINTNIYQFEPVQWQ